MPHRLTTTTATSIPAHPPDEWRRAVADGDDAYDRGDAREAEACFRKALSLGWTFGTDHPRVAVSLSRLARVYIQQRLSEQARQISIQALSMLSAPPSGLDPEETVLTLIALSEASFTIGQLEQAARLVRDAIQHQEQLFGPTHPEVGAALGRLVMIHDRLQQYDAAESCLKRMIAICESNFASNHHRMPELLEARRNLLRKKMGRHAEADQLAQLVMKHDDRFN